MSEQSVPVAIEQAIQDFEGAVAGFWNTYGMLRGQEAFVSAARNTLRAAIRAHLTAQAAGWVLVKREDVDRSLDWYATAEGEGLTDEDDLIASRRFHEVFVATEVSP